MLRPAFLALFALLLMLRPALAEDRHALVIGNSKYEGEAALRNPANDADAMEATLKKLDFKVTKKVDVELAQLEDAVVEFRKSLKKGDVALFFYAGHGVQVKGENYLMPINARIREEYQVKEKCFKVDQVLAAMDESDSALKILILDCCRNNPFTRSWTRSASAKGMAAITEIPNGTVIAFATAPGQTAADGRGANSPYTTHLVTSLTARPKGGLELKEVLFEASRAVKKDYGQVPWLNLDASLDRFYLWHASDSTASAPPVATSTQSTLNTSAKDADAARKRAQAFYPLNKGQEWVYKAGAGAHTLRVVEVGEKSATIEGVGASSAQAHVAREDGVYAVRTGAFYHRPAYKMIALQDGLPVAKGTTWNISHQYGDQNIVGTGEILSDKETIEVPAGKFRAVLVRITFTSEAGNVVNHYWFASGVGVVKQVAENPSSKNVFELKTFRKGE